MRLLSKQDKSIVLMLLAAAVGIFFFFQIVLTVTVDLPEYDEAIHLNIARNVRQIGIPERSGGEGGLFTNHTPLYQYFLGLSTLIVGERLQLLRLLTAVFGIGCILLCYVIGSKLQDQYTGLASAATLALNPFFIYYSFFLREEIPMVFFLLLSLLFVVKWEEKRVKKQLVFAGICLATAVLVRENALLFWFVVLPYVMARSQGLKNRLLNTASVALPVVIGILLWLSWIAALSPSSLYGTYARWFYSIVGSSGAILTESRTGIAIQEWLVTIGSQLLGWETLIFLAAALLLLIFFRPSPLPPIAALLVMYIGLSLVYTIVVSLKELRHIIGIIPMLAILINLLIDWPRLIGWLRLKVKRPVLIASAIILFLIVAWGLSPLQIPGSKDWRNPELWWTNSYQRRMFTDDRYYGVLREAGNYLSGASPEDEIIVVVHQATVASYYANRHYEFLYTMGFDQVMETLKDTNYLVYDAPAFFHLSEEEIGKVDAYIADNFVVAKIVQDDFRQVTIYRRLIE